MLNKMKLLTFLPALPIRIATLFAKDSPYHKPFIFTITNTKTAKEEKKKKTKVKKEKALIAF